MLTAAIKNTSKFKRSTSSTNKPNLEALYFSSHEEFEYLKTSFWRIFPYLKFLQFLDYPGFTPISQPTNLIWYSTIFFSKPQWCPLFSSIVENFSSKVVPSSIFAWPVLRIWFSENCYSFEWIFYIFSKNGDEYYCNIHHQLSLTGLMYLTEFDRF